MKTKQLFIALSFFCAVSLARAVPTLTGISTYGVDTSGAFDYRFWYDTKPISGLYSSHNIYIHSNSLSGPLLNGPTDAAVTPNISLNSSTLTLWFVSELQGDPGPTNIALNLFFDGNTNTGISVYAPTMTSSNAAHSFVTQPNSPIPTLWPYFGPSANSMVYTAGGYQVELLDFAWFFPSVYNVDQTDQYDYGANGLIDGVGVITLQITAVPEPGMAGLIALGVAGGIIARRRRQAAEA